MKDIAIKTSVSAALAAYDWIGKEDKFSADLAAVKAMENILSENNFPAIIAIGEGERDEAPMLYTGQKFGDSYKFDIAVDPLEGTNLCAYNQPGAITVISIADKGIFFPCPDIYMLKIAINSFDMPANIDVDSDLESILKRCSLHLKKSIEDLRVVMLNRPRHQEYIKIALNMGCQVSLIEDGDVLAALSCSNKIDQADIYYGIGGAPEGVITAASISTLGGSFIGTLIASNSAQKKRLASFKFDHKYIFSSEYYRSKNIVTCLSGVTDGNILSGVRKNGRNYICHSLIIDNINKSVQFKENINS